MTLRAGFASCDITPPFGLPLGGYGARVAGADATLDPLCCRAVVLDDGRSTIAIVVLDLVHVFGEWVARVRSRLASDLGIAAERVLIAATHTHSGPGTFRSTTARDDRIAAYECELIDRVVGCV
ncbi:MAG TPA: neutral/alkaline non-lysosomal ceramidase N-terminal domain-containing protein, partial [Candidatus Kryptonia bacterium]|nr:neutral/alkaline non-lysosomal ceramidase N-terminal domain-containing protein [Candidatus Kryptonia bacterium]